MNENQNNSLMSIHGYNELDSSERAMLYTIINLIIVLFYNHKN